MLIHHEGMPVTDGRCMPYRCTAGKLTIGVGRNLDDRGISEEEAFYLLDNDIADCVTDLQSHLSWFNRLDDVRKAVLVDMCFNLGINRLIGFENMLMATKYGEWDKAADEMLDSRWADQVGSRATELATMMRTGEF